MILYTLTCDVSHRFDSWFRDSAAYDDQVSAGLVACPTCHSTLVAKAIMAPAVVGVRQADAPDAIPRPVTLVDDREKDIRARLRDMREKILADGEDVGTRFPEEARKIHDDEIPARRIHGQATRDEARALLEDGVMILPLPTVPEALN